jgi:hypothetical protein
MTGDQTFLDYFLSARTSLFDQETGQQFVLLESAHPAWLSVFPYGHSSFD